MPPRDLARDIFGTRFQNPVLLASGTAGYGREVDGVLRLDRLGGIVTKAISMQPRTGNPPPRVTEFRGGMLNSVGLANPGLVHARDHELPWLVRRLAAARILVNVVGFTIQEYAEVVGGLETFEGIVAFELNLSCPNTSAGGMEFGADAAAVRAIVGECRSVTRKPLIAKLSPALPDIGAMAVVARDEGIDGITVVNTLPGYVSDPAGRPRLGNGHGGISGPAILPAGILAVRRVLERTGGLPVIGVGGIRSGADARQYLGAGATLVAIGTGGLADPRLPERVVRELERGDG